MVIDLEEYYDLNDRISTHVNHKRMQKSKPAHQITVGGIKTKKMAYNVIEGHWRWMASVYLGKVTISLYQCKRWISLAATYTSTMTCTTSYRCAYHQQKPPSLQVTGAETLRNANFAGMTLKAGHRSNKGHGRYNLEIFREDANF